jgi:hypothetical protein
MSWIIIAVVLLVAFGPVLWLVPSRKDRRLAALRARGRAEGLLVELKRLPNPEPRPEERVSSGGKVRNPVIECATYGHMMQSKLVALPSWRLVRVTPGAADEVFPGWQYDQRPAGEGRKYLPELLPAVDDLLKKLPEDVVGFEVGARLLQVYWLEGPGSIEDQVVVMAGLLSDFEALLEGLEADISAAGNVTDS